MNRYNQEHISYYNEIEQQKQIQLQQNRAVLEYQREEAAQRKLLEKLDRRATSDFGAHLSYGPIETDQITQFLKDKKMADQHQMRTILME